MDFTMFSATDCTNKKPVSKNYKKILGRKWQ